MDNKNSTFILDLWSFQKTLEKDKKENKFFKPQPHSTITWFYVDYIDVVDFRRFTSIQSNFFFDLVDFRRFSRFNQFFDDLVDFRRFSRFNRFFDDLVDFRRFTSIQSIFFFDLVDFCQFFPIVMINHIVKAKTTHQHLATKQGLPPASSLMTAQQSRHFLPTVQARPCLPRDCGFQIFQQPRWTGFSRNFWRRSVNLFRVLPRWQASLMTLSGYVLALSYFHVMKWSYSSNSAWSLQYQECPHGYWLAPPLHKRVMWVDRRIDLHLLHYPLKYLKKFNTNIVNE